MRRWLRARRLGWLLAAAALMVGLDRLVGTASLSVPALFGGGSDVVLVRTYLPLLWASATATAFAGRLRTVEIRPPSYASTPFSRLGLCDAALFASTSLSAAVLVSGASGAGLTGVGPVLVLAGLACLATLHGGPALGALVSTMAMIATSVYPRTGPGARFVHVLQSDGEPGWSAACGLGLVLVATVLLSLDSARARLGPGVAGDL